VTRGRRVSALAALLLGGVVALAQPAPAGSSDAAVPLLTAAGEGHGLELSGPVVQPVRTPAFPQLVATSPEGGGEVWAAAWTTTPSTVPGYDPKTTQHRVNGQMVFMHEVPGHGWVSAGPPMEDGQAKHPSHVASIAVAPNGDAWAGGQDDEETGQVNVMYHKPPGATTWQVVEQPVSGSSGPLTYEVDALSLGSDQSGTYGFAVLRDGTVEMLQGGAWTTDTTAVDNQVVQVVATSSTTGWAVGGAAAKNFSACQTSGAQGCLATLQALLVSTANSQHTPDLFYRDSSGWRTVKLSSLPQNDGQGFSVVASGSTAWIGGTTGTGPWVARVDSSPGGPTVSNQVTSWCAAGSAGGCSGGTMPDDSGAMYALDRLGSGDIFAAGGAGGSLLHLTPSGSGGSWAAEPDTVGPAGVVAFTSARDGWVAKVDALYRVGAATSSPELGHFTASPAAPALRSWPDSLTSRLTAVATDPSGSGVVLAGGDGVIQRLDPSTGLWTPMALPAGVSGPIRGFSWPAGGSAWAVAGPTILRLDGGAWRTVPIQGDLHGSTLQAIAVSPKAVGSGAGATAPPTPPPTPPPTDTGSPGVAQTWGDNQNGELGDGTTAPRPPVPGVVPGLSGVVQVAGNVSQEQPGGDYTFYSVALLRDGTVYQWGTLFPGDTSRKPQKVPGLDGHDITAISAGADHVLALDDAGHVWSWGDNAFDQLGNGAASTAPQPQSTAQQVLFSPTTTLTSVAAGATHSLAVDSQGNVWCWGDTSHGECGQIGAGKLRVPTAVPGVSGAATVAAGAYFSLALLANHSVFSWGSDQYDNLGRTDLLSTTAQSWVPEAVPNLAASSIAAGEDFAVAADNTTGGLIVWGRNDHGQIPGSSDTDSLPVTVSGLGGSGVKTLAAAGAHGLALMNDGRVLCWGQNDDGECGFIGTHKVTSPLVVPGLAGVRSVGAGQLSSLAVTPPPPPAAAGQNTPPPAPQGSPPGPMLGYAVGTHGVTVRFDGRSWVVDPTSTAQTDQTLRTVVLSGRDAVAGGDVGTLLVDPGDGWVRGTIPDGEVDAYVQDGQQKHVVGPMLDVGAALPDGTVLLAGERGTILQRLPSADPHNFELAALPPVEGWVHGLSAARDRTGRLRAAVIVGYDPNIDVDYGHPDDLTVLTGSVLVDQRDGWRDGELADSLQDGTGDISPPNQTPWAPRLDEALGVALDPRGGLGWAVGKSGSTWRLALDGTPPASPMSAVTELDPGPGLSFAFLSNTGCFEGTCRRQLGWGGRGDTTLLTAMRTIDRLGREGRVGFVSLGGDLRSRTGAGGQLDLAALDPLFGSTSVPVFAAPGATDLSGGSPSAWEAAFAGAAAPWGDGHRWPSIRPVGWLPGQSPGGGRAATHYAFDDMRDGVAVLRVVVLDTSSVPVSANDANQNPTEPQAAWLADALVGARTLNVPVVLVMNQLAVATTPSTGAGDPAIEATVDAAVTAKTGIVGILAAGEPANQQINALVATQIPVGIFAGGGGRFLKPGQSGPVPGEDTLHGFYNSWQLVTLDDGASTVRIRSIPVLQQIALSAPRGRSAAAGTPLAFQGLGRAPRAAGLRDYSGTGDTEFMAPTLGFPFPRNCGATSPGGGPGCSPTNVKVPDYRFSSSDDSVLVPVLEDPKHLGHPVHDTAGHPVPDSTGTSGLFCAEKPGTVMVRLEAGDVAAQLPVTVTAGSVGAGECGPIPPAPPVASHVLRAVVPPAVVQPAKPVPGGVLPLRVHSHMPQPPSVGIAVPPPVNVIPAPPGGAPGGQGAEKREEESEAAMEDAKMTALNHDRSGGSDALALAGSALGILLAGTALGIGARRRKPRVAAAVVGDWRSRRWR
jgi:alpha-tubulin suppressor-like RCC1 family protein